MNENFSMENSFDVTNLLRNKDFQYFSPSVRNDILDLSDNCEHLSYLILHGSRYKYFNSSFISHCTAKNVSSEMKENKQTNKKWRKSPDERKMWRKVRKAEKKENVIIRV